MTGHLSRRVVPTTVGSGAHKVAFGLNARHDMLAQYLLLLRMCFSRLSPSRSLHICASFVAPGVAHCGQWRRPDTHCGPGRCRRAFAGGTDNGYCWLRFYR